MYGHSFYISSLVPIMHLIVNVNFMTVLQTLLGIFIINNIKLISFETSGISRDKASLIFLPPICNLFSSMKIYISNKDWFLDCKCLIILRVLVCKVESFDFFCQASNRILSALRVAWLSYLRALSFIILNIQIEKILTLWHVIIVRHVRTT